MARPAWLVAKLRKERRDKIIKHSIIPERALDAFVRRHRRDFRVFKRYSERKLDELAAELPIDPPFWDKLTRVQKACVIIGAREGRFAFFNDTGTGKTFLLAALAEYFWQLGDVDHVLVLVPRRPNKYEWADQLRKHCPKLPFVVLEGSTENKLALMEDNPEALLFIESYGGLPHIASKLKENKKKNKRELKPNESRLKKLRAFFQGVLTDEGVNGGLGNKETLPWRVCRQITRDPRAIYFTATATPFGRDPMLLWSQMWLVDRGVALGENQALFRNVFYTAVSTNFKIDFTFRKLTKPMLYDFLADGSIRFDADEADLPRTVPDVLAVSLPGEAGAYYEKAKAAMKAARGDFLEQKNAFLRMRQISSGFVGYTAEGEKAKLIFDDNPKLDLLLSKLEAIGESYKSIVFYEFTWSGLKIAEELRKLWGKSSDTKHLAPLHLWSGTKNAKEVLERFNHDPDYPVLVIQNTFGIGLNIQVAKYGWFYEAPLSPITRVQCWKRIERQHSKHRTVFITDLVMRETQDEKILKFYEEGEDLFQAIIKGKVEA